MNSSNLNFHSQMLKLTPTLRTAFNLFAAASTTTSAATSAAFSTFPAKPISESHSIKPSKKTKASINIKNSNPISPLSSTTTAAASSILNFPAKPIETPQKTKSSTRIKNNSATYASAAVLYFPAKPIIATEPIEHPQKNKASTRIKKKNPISSGSCTTTTCAASSPAVLDIRENPIVAFEPNGVPTKKKSSTISAGSCSATTSPAVLDIAATDILASEANEVPTKTKASRRVKTSKAVAEALLKENWLGSLSCPMLSTSLESGFDPESEWVLGVDPDVSGALAVLRPDRSVEVFDSPHLKVRVGKGIRKRLDAKSIVELVKRFNAPIGTTVYVEQSIPFPQDGKQGWWGGGFGYGMWIGILVASGFSVVPVPSLSWKNEFKLSGSRSSKDASRELASKLFPSTSSLLKRKKDHGRAEALLIAAYGKGLKLMSRSSCMTDSKSL